MDPEGRRMAIFFRDIWAFWVRDSSRGKAGREARKERVGKFSKAGRILQANSVNSVWWNFEREHDPSTEKYLANCKNRRRNFYEGCKSWIAGGEGLEKKNCKKRKKHGRIGKNCVQEKFRLIWIRINFNYVQLKDWLNLILKMIFSKNIFSEIKIDRIRILKSLTCTTSTLSHARFQKRRKKKRILSLFNFQRFLLTYPSFSYTRIYYARKMCLLIKDSACGLCKTRFLPLSSEIRRHDWVTVLVKFT